jgi:hypothetical protein
MVGSTEVATGVRYPRSAVSCRPNIRRWTMDLTKVGNARSPVAVILLSLITFGIYSLYWQYASFKELRAYSGEGIGGGFGLLFAILLGIVNAFLLPMEVGRLYSAEGRAEPVSGLTGFWVLLPLVGWIIWVIKTQGRLNDYWESHGAHA